MNSNRAMTIASVLLATVLASGCMAEPVHRRPMRVDQGYTTMVVAQAPPEWVVARVDSRPGYVWAQGYWRWDGRRYVAVRGHYERARPGSRYVQPRWEHRRDGWHWRDGAWAGR